jgi:N-acetylneuraminic acid mutarotase
MIPIDWQDLTPLPRPASGCMAVLADGGYCAAGGTAWQDGVKTFLADVQIYDLTSGKWRAGPPLPVPLAYGVAVAAPGGMAIYGGADAGKTYREGWRWETGADGWTRAEHLPEALVLARAVVVGGEVFVFGGAPEVADLTAASAKVWRRAADGWEHAGDLPGGPLVMMALAASEGLIYCFGGCSMPAAGAVENSAAAWAYDPAAGTWTALRPLRAPVRGAAAVTLSPGRIAILGGYAGAGAGHGFDGSVRVYDCRADAYTDATPLPAGVSGIEFVLAGDMLLGTCGEDGVKRRFGRLLAGRVAP